MHLATQDAHLLNLLILEAESECDSIMIRYKQQINNNTFSLIKMNAYTRSSIGPQMQVAWASK